MTSVHNYPILELTTFPITFQADTSIYSSTGLTLFHITPSTGDVGAYGEFAATYAVSPGFFVLPKLTVLLFSFCVPALQTVFVLVFLVIVPLCNPAGNLWNLIDETATEKGAYGRMPALANLIAPMILLVSGLTLSVSKQIMTDITILSSSHQTKRSVFLFCVFWWSA